jgi:nitroimidazol reductase NimA-like FMN-containing flavoprotein (pyridoxamine 5'-phosphate oxidase superfamily)
MTKLRRAEKEIKDKSEVDEILRLAYVGRLGTCLDGEPYVVPLSFAYDGCRIIFHGPVEGKKMTVIAGNPRVCFEVDEYELIPGGTSCEYSFRYRSVVAKGIARVVQDPEIRLEGLKLLVEKYAPGKSDEITKERLGSFRNLTIVEIEIKEMTGKTSPVSLSP